MFKLLTALLAAFSMNAFAMPAIGDISAILDTPACEILESSRIIFGHQFSKPALMQLDGQKVRFDPGVGQKSLWDYTQTNEIVSTVYYSANQTVKIDGRVTDSCTGHDCEFVAIEVSLEFIDHVTNSSQTFTGLSGVCGV